MIRVRRFMFGSAAIAGAVGPEPSKSSVVGTLDRPTVLVDEPMVEPTDEQEVVEVGGTSPRPPHDVVRVGELRRPAPREPAPSVPMAELPHHR